MASNQTHLWAITLGALMVAVGACPAAQPQICTAPVFELKEREAAELRAVSQSGVCDAHADLMQCPEARTVAARWAKVWDRWEACP